MIVWINSCNIDSTDSAYQSAHGHRALRGSGPDDQLLDQSYPRPVSFWCMEMQNIDLSALRHSHVGLCTKRSSLLGALSRPCVSNLQRNMLEQ